MHQLVKRSLAKVAYYYFTPLWFEEKLYEFLGVRIFKKYLPTTGDLMMKYFYKQKLLDDGKTATLAGYARKDTIECEKIHLVMFTPFLLSFLSFPFWVAVAMNLFWNVYPIMLQRYNRARIYRLLKRREQLKWVRPALIFSQLGRS